MTPNPILKVLSTLSSHQVQYLLMGGQACVLYGAAEFSRDTDVAVPADEHNLGRLQSAVDALAAESIAVPPFAAEYLRRGHAVHFRCRHPEAQGLRIDVMSVLRGVDAFDRLWNRRSTVVDPDGTAIEVMSLPDLVQAKKTQRDKDWPMIRRLIEAHYLQHRQRPTDEHIAFWLCQARTPEILAEVAQSYPDLLRAMSERRPLLVHVQANDVQAVAAGLEQEEMSQRDADRAYWAPLRAELERLRRDARHG